MPRLFVSYSHVDQDLVEQTIAPYFDAAGVEVWYARRNMVASQDFNLKILEQLRQSDWFLVILSPASVQSSYVQAEVKAAFDEELPVIPCIVEACEPEVCDLRLKNLHAVSFDEEGQDALAHALAMLLADDSDTSIPLAKSEPTDSPGDSDPNTIDRLRRLRAQPDAAQTAWVLGCLATSDEQVQQRAQQVLHRMGWSAISQAVDPIVRRGDAQEIQWILDGLEVLDARAESVRILDRLGDLLLHGEYRQRVLALVERKRLSLGLDRIAQMFRTTQSEYELVRVLGQGLFTESYLARHLRSGHQIVVRALKRELVRQPEIRSRYLDLCARAMTYRGSSLAMTFHQGEAPDQKLYYSLRDYVPGAPLQSALDRKQRFEPLQVLEILIQVAEALRPVHSAGHVHLGVKPTNVFIGRDQKITLGDPTLTLLSLPLGLKRLAYDYRFAAPETFEEGRALEPRTDLYSVGSLAYELACRRPVFDGQSPVQLLQQHLNTPVAPPSRVGSILPAQADALIVSLLAKKPGDRPQSLDAVLGELEKLKRSLTTSVNRDVAIVSGTMISRIERPASVMSITAAGIPEGTIVPSGNLSRDVVSPPPDDTRPGDGPAPEETSADDVDDFSVERTFPPPKDTSGDGHLERRKPADVEDEMQRLSAEIPGIQIKGLIGQGGMGRVYHGWQEVLERTVAVKVLGSMSVDEQFRERFRREAKSLAKLTHPNIVAAYSAGVTTTGEHYIVMEYVDGPTLEDVVRKEGPMEVQRVVDAMLQVAAGLSYIAEHGIVHRDIKPSNLIVAPNGEVKILDLGIARGSREPASPNLTSAGMLGTPLYMAPEQWQDAQDVSPATDLYSFACSFYFVLTGEPPFADRETWKVGHRHVSEQPVAPSRKRLKIPKALDRILLRLLEKDPARRGSVTDLIDELFRLQRPSKSSRRGLFGRWRGR